MIDSWVVIYQPSDSSYCYLRDFTTLSYMCYNGEGEGEGEVFDPGLSAEPEDLSLWPIFQA